jgi:hypothetical protein
MLPSESPEAPATPAVASPSLSPLQRAIAIFVRPAAAWDGLTGRAQWWIPFVIVLVVLLAGAAITYQRVQLPTILDTMQERVSSGEMTPEQLQRIEDFYTGPAGLAVMLGSLAVSFAVIPFVVALLIWFAVGFVLGSPFKYRHALEVGTWSSLVAIPQATLQYVLSWIHESARGVHVGFRRIAAGSRARRPHAARAGRCSWTGSVRSASGTSWSPFWARRRCRAPRASRWHGPWARCTWSRGWSGRGWRRWCGGGLSVATFVPSWRRNDVRERLHNFRTPRSSMSMASFVHEHGWRRARA